MQAYVLQPPLHWLCYTASCSPTTKLYISKWNTVGNFYRLERFYISKHRKFVVQILGDRKFSPFCNTVGYSLTWVYCWPEYHATHDCGFSSKKSGRTSFSSSLGIFLIWRSLFFISYIVSTIFYTVFFFACKKVEKQ